MSMIIDWESPRGNANVRLENLEIVPTDYENPTDEQTAVGTFQLLDRAGNQLASVELEVACPPACTVDQAIVALHDRLQQTLEDVMVRAFQKARQLHEQQDRT